MPKDHWKKARDADHTKRAKLERAVGLPSSYDYVWDADIDAEAISPCQPPSDAQRSPGYSTLLTKWLRRLGISCNEDNARLQLNRVGAIHASAIPLLLAAFNHTSLVARKASVEILARIGEPAIERVVQRLIDGTEGERSCSVDCLVKIGEAAQEQVVSLLNHDDRNVQGIAISIIDKRGDSLPILWSLLTTGTSSQKQLAKTALIRAGREAVPYLIHCLEQETLDNGIMAIAMLGCLGKQARSAVPILQEICESADNRHVKVAATKAWNAIRQDLISKTHIKKNAPHANKSTVLVPKRQPAAKQQSKRKAQYKKVGR